MEIYFSGLERVMGEIIKAMRPEYIAQEIAMKVHYYNILRQMTEAYLLCNTLCNCKKFIYK